MRSQVPGERTEALVRARDLSINPQVAGKALRLYDSHVLALEGSPMQKE